MSRPYLMPIRQPLIPDIGRVVIAITAVRQAGWAQPDEITDHPDHRPPTDVMIIMSLPATRPSVITYDALALLNRSKSTDYCLILTKDKKN